MPSVGSVSVEVVPDATGFPEKLKAKLRDLKVQVGVELDDKGLRQKLDALTRSKSLKVGVELDDRGVASRLDEITRTRTAKIRADVDQSSFARAQSTLSGLSSELFSLKGLALTLGPALVPLTAGLAGLGGGLAAVGGAGIGAGGIFGAFSIGALAKAKKDLTAIQALQKKASSATTTAQARDYAKQADALLRSLPRSEQAFLKARGSISSTFNKLLQGKTGESVFAPLAAGASLLAKVMPKLSPIVRAFGDALTTMLGSLSKWTDGKGFKGLVDFLATTGVQSFKTFVDILRNVAVGVGGMIRAFAPMGTSILDVIDRATKKFADFGKTAGDPGSGFQSFLSYVRDNGPLLASTFKNLAGAFINVGKALAPQGGTALSLVNVLAKLTKNVSPATLAAIAGGVGAIGLATGKFGKLTSLTLLVSAISYAYKHSDAFRTLADDAGKLAVALNKLPTGVKVGGALAIGAGALAARGRGGIVGGAVSKVLGGGVQKVFVVNMGQGGLGPGGVGGAGGPGTPGVHRGKVAAGVVGKLAADTVGALAVTALGNKLEKGLQNSHGGADAGRVVKNVRTVNALGGFSRSVANRSVLGIDLGSHNAHKDLESADKALAHLVSSGNAKAAAAQFAAINREAVKQHVSLKNVTASFPKYQSALTVASGKSAGFGRAVAAAAGVMVHSGITAVDYGHKLRSLPKGVQTKVTTPGAITSRGDVQALKRQFDLTPKQVRTLMQISGVGQAIADASRLKSVYAGIPRTIVTQAITQHINKFDRVTKHNAAGTDFWAGGPTWVGELGPEIVNLPRGAQVLNHAEAKASVSKGSDRKIEVTVNDRSGDPVRTAKETARRLAFAGSH